MLSRIYGSEGGPETLDVLMKYLYAIQILPGSPKSLDSGYINAVSNANQAPFSNQIQRNVAHFTI